MKTIDPNIIVLNQESDVGLLTNAVRAICRDNLFDLVDTEQMVLACSEIGHNAVRHGKGGTAQIYELKEGKSIKVIIADGGPGIANIDLAKREGYSTVLNSLGLGLEGAQRLVDNFEIESELSKGTKVTLEKHRPLSKELVDYGLVSIPDNNYNYNGDQYIRKEYDGDSLLMGVVDGPGQGYDAHSIAQTCKQFIENNYRKPLAELIAALNILMKESNDETGVTCSLARITQGNISYHGLGDTHAYIQIDNQTIKSLTNQDGRLGYVNKIKERSASLTFEATASMVICSDGIRTMNEEINCVSNAQQLANELFDKYHRPSGDATVFIAKYTI